jgi:hypothetical protein
MVIMCENVFYLHTLSPQESVWGALFLNSAIVQVPLEFGLGSS